MDSEIQKDYQEIARLARVKVLELIYKRQVSHIGSNFSVIDLLTVLFEKVNIKNDEIILSKGWAAAAWYYFLWKKGQITEEELNSYCREGSKFIGLVEPMNRWGLRFAGGSMGYGLPAGVGFALAKKLNREEGKIYVIMSDGEMQCGTTWESALIAAQHKLDNLVVIVDNNKLQAMGKTNEILNIEPLKNKWHSFGWTTQVRDGHDYRKIEWALSTTKFPCSECDGKGNLNYGGQFKDSNKYRLNDGTCARCSGTGIFDSKENIYEEQPKIILFNTIKGKGVSFMENNNLYHYKNLSDDEYQKAKKELCQN